MKTIGFSSRFAGLLAISAMLAGSSLHAAETGKAELTGVKGSVKIDGQPATVGQAIKPGQKIETGAGAQANLYLADNGPTVVVLPDSSISFDELTVDKSGAEPVVTTKINLKVGTVAGYVKKTSSQSSYIVKGPTVTAVIRTSEYQVTDNGTVSVWSGCVTVSYRGVSYEVCGGQMFDPAAASVIANAMPLPAGMPSSVQQSANVTVTAPTVATRPQPVPTLNFPLFVVEKNIVDQNGKTIFVKGDVINQVQLQQATIQLGAGAVSTKPVPQEGVIVIVNPGQIPGLNKGDVKTPAEIEALIKEFGDKAFQAEKVVPSLVVTPEGIAPKKPEVVASPTTTGGN